MNDTHKFHDILHGPVDSVYKRMFNRNHCNHRDYQNIAVNGTLPPPASQPKYHHLLHEENLYNILDIGFKACSKHHWFRAFTLNLFQYYLCCTFGRFLIKIHVHVKEVQLESTKEKISKTTSFTHYHYFLIKIHRNESRFPTEIYNHDGECWHLLSIGKSLWIPPTILQRYYPDTLISLAVENPRRLFIFSRILKPDKL